MSLKIKIFEPFEIESTHFIYQKYDFGLVSLIRKLTTNKIPGKYASYISYGLPVFVYCSPKIDLFNEVNDYQIGVDFNPNFLILVSLSIFLKTIRQHLLMLEIYLWRNIALILILKC